MAEFNIFQKVIIKSVTFQTFFFRNYSKQE
jgi:hypothetical protein